MGLAIISYLAVQSSSTLHLCLQPVRVDVCRSWSDGDLLKRYGLVDINMGWITLGQLCGPLSLLENSVRVVLGSLLCRGIESTSFVMIWMLSGLDRNSWVLAGVAAVASVAKLMVLPGASGAWLVSVVTLVGAEFRLAVSVPRGRYAVDAAVVLWVLLVGGDWIADLVRRCVPGNFIWQPAQFQMFVIASERRVNRREHTWCSRTASTPCR